MFDEACWQAQVPVALGFLLRAVIYGTRSSRKGRVGVTVMNKRGWKRSLRGQSRTRAYVPECAQKIAPFVFIFPMRAWQQAHIGVCNMPLRGLHLWQVRQIRKTSHPSSPKRESAGCGRRQTGQTVRGYGSSQSDVLLVFDVKGSRLEHRILKDGFVLLETWRLIAVSPSSTLFGLSAWNTCCFSFEHLSSWYSSYRLFFFSLSMLFVEAALKDIYRRNLLPPVPPICYPDIMDLV